MNFPVSGMIDVVPVDILCANHFVQAVPIPAGRHTVSFRYPSTRLGAGLMLRRKSGAGPAPPGAGATVPPTA